jgi:hypothetical protein
LISPPPYDLTTIFEPEVSRAVQAKGRGIEEKELK